MRRPTLLLPALVAPVFVSGSLAAAVIPGDAVLGEWQGRSICVHQPPGSPCRDEIVRYTFTRGAAGAPPYHLVADKRVGGEWATMGEMDFAYAADSGRWTCRFDAPRCPACTWWFRIDEAGLTGGLTDEAGVELREVKATRPAP